jgi:membrane-bound inhibitor of C-type lysozyme
MISPECATEWVQRTCKEQGVKVKVMDPEALSAVVAILGSGARHTGGVAPRIKDARPA